MTENPRKTCSLDGGTHKFPSKPFLKIWELTSSHRNFPESTKIRDFLRQNQNDSLKDNPKLFQNKNEKFACQNWNDSLSKIMRRKILKLTLQILHRTERKMSAPVPTPTEQAIRFLTSIELELNKSSDQPVAKQPTRKSTRTRKPRKQDAYSQYTVEDLREYLSNFYKNVSVLCKDELGKMYDRHKKKLDKASEQKEIRHGDGDLPPKKRKSVKEAPQPKKKAKTQDGNKSKRAKVVRALRDCAGLGKDCAEVVVSGAVAAGAVAKVAKECADVIEKV